MTGSRERLLALIGTGTGSFVVSFLFMWHERGPVQRPVTAATVHRALDAPRPALQHGSDALPAPLRTDSAHDVPVVAQGSATSLGDESDLASMPVVINLWNRRNRPRVEGRVSNTSSEPIAVRLEVAGGHSSLQLDLGPGMSQDFSSDAAFEMQPNDRVVVHSDSYRDIVAEVP